MHTLHLYAGADAVEEAWRLLLARAPGGAVELGRGHLTTAELVEAAARAAHPRAERLGPLAERLLLDAVAESAGGPYAKVAGTRGLARGLMRLVDALRRAGVSPAELRDAGKKAGSAHATELARRLAAYEKLRRDRFDGAEVWRRGLEALAAGPALAALEDVRAVELHGMFEWDGPRLALVDALLARGLAVRVHLPAAEGGLARALAPTLAALEARHAEHLDVVRGEVMAGAVERICAAAPGGEAREVARRVRDLAAAGASPESIAVVAATPERRARLAEALDRYGVPVLERRPAPAANAPPVRIALDLYALVAERLPRERLIALFSSRYVAGGAAGPEGFIPPHRIARALRKAGAGDASGYAARLAEWVRAQRPADQPQALAILGHVERWVGLLGGLPETATFSAHARALAQVLEALELPARARGFRRDGGSRPGASLDDGAIPAATRAAEERAIARDQAAMRELESALVDLPRAAARVGLGAEPVSRARFARLLGEALAARPIRAGGVRGAAVELTTLERAAGRGFAHLFVCGLVEGELPARGQEEPLVPDEERLALDRALGRPVLRAPSAEETSGLAFAAALGGAARVHLSWTRADQDGAPLLRSPFVEHAPPGPLAEVGLEPVPPIADARTLDEMRARVALETRGDRASRLSRADADAGPALERLLTARAPGRAARLAHLAEVEQKRDQYFEGLTPAHPFTGALVDAELRARVAAGLPGTETVPLSASSLERYAACPFQFFLRSHLRAALPEEADDDLDPMRRGNLLHRLFERFFRRAQASGRLPLRGAAEERALADATCDEVFAEVEREGGVGHPELFRAHTRKLRRQVHAVVRAEAESPPADGCVPTWFEEPFGPLAIPAPGGGGEAIFLAGKIDRVDVGVGRALVLDYKSGTIESYRLKAKPEAQCVTAWQLPVYAAAVRARLGGEAAVEARFYSVRGATLTKPVTAPETLPDALWQLVGRMRAGDFAVRPREDACARCRMEAACRVVRRGLDEDET